jgi:pantoate--beta-alanine ligase
MMHQFSNIPELQQWRRSIVGTVVLVPTMGNLHEGHAALIRLALAQGGVVVVSLFVNPSQFGPHEDFERYPRTLEADIALCQGLGVTAIFTPTIEAMYPEGLETTRRFTLIPPERLVNRYCGANRPGHFDGVCTVVGKLFNAVQPTHAVFGQKDAQQLAVLRAMASEMAWPVELLAHPVVRSGEGLALSSRNQYLNTPELKETALALFETMKGVATAYHVLNVALPVAKAFELAWQGVKSQYPMGDVLKWEYQAAVEDTTFEAQETLTPHSRLLVAARLGNIRLIDTLHVREVLHESL